MGTTLDDGNYEGYLLDQAYEAFEEEVLARQEKLKQQNIIDEEAWKIFDFLPINKTQQLEEEYIKHLWSSFVHLNSGSEESRQFSIMPFHLLFMLSLQYKVLRIHRQRKKKYDLAFTMENPRNGEEEVLSPQSVFTLGFIGESKMVDLFKLVGTDSTTIKRIKDMIRYRNDKLAHAKGGITYNLEIKIDEYLKCLNELQHGFQGMNDQVADKWVSEIGEEQGENEYIEVHLGEEYLCPADIKQGRLSKIVKKTNTST